MPLDLWIFNKHRRYEMKTLEHLMGVATTVECKTVYGNSKAKEELSAALPFETVELIPLAKDVKTDFIPGYDDKFPRIDFDIIRNATKDVNGVCVPAFAFYDVFRKNNVCERTYKISAYKYETANENTLALIPHNKYFMNIRGLYEGAVGPAVVVVGVLPGGILNCFWFGLLADSLTANIIMGGIGFVGSLLSTFCFAGLFFLGDKKITRTFSHKFSGLVPENIRDIIKTNKFNFDSIYLVEEAHSWDIVHSEKIIKPVVEPRNVDPLIVGVKNDKAWILAKFDVTPLEQLIASEFSA